MSGRGAVPVVPPLMFGTIATGDVCGGVWAQAHGLEPRGG
jgi:hypothetical protein